MLGDSEEPVLSEAHLARHEVGLELTRLELNGVVVLVDGRLEGKREEGTSKGKV